MKALVISGAANYGTLQAGALDAIFASGFRPEMVVGTSAGALNAIYVAYDPSPEGVERLQDLWRAAGPKQVGSPTAAGVVRRLIRKKDSLVPGDALGAFLGKHLPQGVETFGELREHSGIPAYAVAVNMDTAELYGEHGSAAILSAMAGWRSTLSGWRSLHKTPHSCGDRARRHTDCRPGCDPCFGLERYC